MDDAAAGQRGAVPRHKGARLGKCAQIAAAADWAEAVIHVYGQGATVQIASCQALWHGSFKTAPGQLVLVRDPGSRKPYDLGLFTLDTTASPAAIAERYSWRWPIEPSNATGKQLIGAGDACNRVQKALAWFCWTVRKTLKQKFRSATCRGPTAGSPAPCSLFCKGCT